MASGRRRDYETAIEQLAEYLSLSHEAIEIAEGWSILPPTMQRHFHLMISDYIASQAPVLQPLYAASSHQDQLRFNRIIERAQAAKRGPQGDAS